MIDVEEKGNMPITPGAIVITNRTLPLPYQCPSCSTGCLDAVFFTMHTLINEEHEVKSQVGHDSGILLLFGSPKYSPDNNDLCILLLLPLEIKGENWVTRLSSSLQFAYLLCFLS